MDNNGGNQEFEVNSADTVSSSESLEKENEQESRRAENDSFVPENSQQNSNEPLYDSSDLIVKRINNEIVNKVTAVVACICFVFVFWGGIVAASMPPQTEHQKNMNRLKTQFSHSVPLHDSRLIYKTIDPDYQENTAEIIIESKSSFSDFYSLLSLFDDIRQYAETCVEFDDRDLKVEYVEKFVQSEYRGFSIMFETDGNVDFYYNWHESADLKKIAECFPDVSCIEFSESCSEFAAKNIEELTGLSNLKIIKLKFGYGVENYVEYEKRIEELFPNCVVYINNKIAPVYESYDRYQDFNEHVKFRNSDWRYDDDLFNLDGLTEAEVFVTGDNLRPDDFYDMLCTMRDIAQYMKTRDDCRNKSITVGFDEFADECYDFSIRYDLNGDVVFCNNWITVLNLEQAVAVFPEITKVEFGYNTSEFGASHITDLANLRNLKSIKFVFQGDIDITPEQREQIEELFPDCEIETEYIDKMY